MNGFQKTVSIKLVEVFMKKKSVFRKIALLLTITLIVNLGVFDVFSFDSKADGTTIEIADGHEYTCETDTTISDNVFIHNTGKLTINSDAHLTINGNVTVQGTIINNGQLTINGNINILGGNYIQVSKGAVVNSEGAIAIFQSITSNSFTTGNILNPTTQTYVDNKGTVEVIDENSTPNVKNSGNGMLIYNHEYYNTDNLDLNISISGTKSAVDDTKYIGSVTITPVMK